MKNALLIMTVGRTDVQFALDEGSKRAGIDEGLYLELQEKVDLGEYRLVDTPENRTPREDQPEALPDSLVLCAPKLDPVLKIAVEEGYSIQGAVILDTESKRSGPRHVYTVLHRRLKECSEVEASLLIFLKDGESLKDPSNPRGIVVREEAVKRIEDGICKAIKESQAETILVSAAGGFPDIVPVVEQAVRLYAQFKDGKVRKDVRMVDVPEREASSIRKPALRPDISFEARRVALELIREGHLLGAWGAVQHLHNDPVEKQWTKVIEWLYLWAASLPQKEDCDIPFLNICSAEQHLLAPRAACLVEFALRAGDIPRAVQGTVSFYEAAMWDFLLRDRVDPHPLIESIHPNRLGWCKFKDPPTFNINAFDSPFQNAGRTGSGVPYYKVNISKRVSRDQMANYIERTPFTALNNATTQELRDLRNDVAHNVPTPAIMDIATKMMQMANLWSGDNKFLGQPLINGTLSELEVPEPADLCEDLIAEIEKRLIQPL